MSRWFYENPAIYNQLVEEDILDIVKTFAYAQYFDGHLGFSPALFKNKGGFCLPKAKLDPRYVVYFKHMKNQKLFYDTSINDKRYICYSTKNFLKSDYSFWMLKTGGVHYSEEKKDKVAKPILENDVVNLITFKSNKSDEEAKKILLNAKENPNTWIEWK